MSSCGSLPGNFPKTADTCFLFICQQWEVMFHCTNGRVTATLCFAIGTHNSANLQNFKKHKVL